MARQLVCGCRRTALLSEAIMCEGQSAVVFFLSLQYNGHLLTLSFSRPRRSVDSDSIFLNTLVSKKLSSAVAERPRKNSFRKKIC